MKHILLSLVFSFTSNLALAAFEPMEKVMAEQSGSFYVGALPAGYSAKDIFNTGNGTTVLPEVSESLKNAVDKIIVEEKINWANYVQASPWEFVSCPVSTTENETELAKECYEASKATLDQIAADPEGTIGLQIVDTEAFHEIYKDGVLVGYVLELSNNVDASIIEDGSGIVIYLDANMNVLLVDTWQS